MTEMTLEQATIIDQDTSDLEAFITYLSNESKKKDGSQDLYDLDIAILYDKDGDKNDKNREKLSEILKNYRDLEKKADSPQDFREKLRNKKTFEYGTPASAYSNGLESQVSGQEPSPEFEEVVRAYRNEHHQELSNYMSERGRSPIEIIAVRNANLPGNTIAAVLSDGYAGILLANKNNGGFKNNLKKVSKRYNVPDHIAERYVMDHEHVHIYGVKDEKEVDTILSELYNQKIKEFSGSVKEGAYRQLAKIAETRLGETGINYETAA